MLCPGTNLQRCPLSVTCHPVHQVASLPSLKASKYFINYVNPHGGWKKNCTAIALPLYPFYSIYFADGISWVDRPAASSPQFLKFWVQGRLWLGKLRRPHCKSTEHTDLAVGSRRYGPKSIKVIALLKLLVWFIIFTKIVKVASLLHGVAGVRLMKSCLSQSSEELSVFTWGSLPTSDQPRRQQDSKVLWTVVSYYPSLVF